jgi:hypothetical protein
MTKKDIKQVLDRVLSWPPERQEDAARVLSEMEAHDASDYYLTDEQAAEVKRRLAESNPRYLTLEEVEALFARRRA